MQQNKGEDCNAQRFNTISFQNRGIKFVGKRRGYLWIFSVLITLRGHDVQKAVSKPYKERLRDVTQVAENPSQVQMVEH